MFYIEFTDCTYVSNNHFIETLDSNKNMTSYSGKVIYLTICHRFKNIPFHGINFWCGYDNRKLEKYLVIFYATR